MSGTPELVKRNEMYRWGRNDGLRTGVVLTLAAVLVVAVVVAVAMALGAAS